MIFISEKRRQEYKDVMLVFLYFGLIFLIFSSLIFDSLFFFEVLIIGMILLLMALGMNIIALYYYITRSKKNRKLRLERTLCIFVFSCIVIMSTILYFSLGIKLRLL
ncbi:MAG: hypothetical protein ACFFBP_21420 [Promethearchaeota archaeon]